jgi:hypothetical protein
MRDTNLVNALREHAEWAQANEWETPITLGDDLTEAADRLENQNAHIAALQQEIEKLRGQVPRWLPVEERLPELQGWGASFPRSPSSSRYGWKERIFLPHLAHL